MQPAAQCRKQPTGRRYVRWLGCIQYPYYKENVIPFQPIKSGKNKGKYRSPSGEVFTKQQVALYHATGGFAKKKKTATRRKK